MGKAMEKAMPKYTVTVSDEKGFFFYAESFVTRKQAEIYISFAKAVLPGGYKYRLIRNPEF